MKYEDNLIAQPVSKEFDKLTEEIHKTYPKASGWLPFNTYDMVQCGYPFPNHGEMVKRSDGGTNSKGELIPSTGMWCKVEDVMKIINELKFKNSCLHNDTFTENGIKICKQCNTHIEITSYRD